MKFSINKPYIIFVILAVVSGLGFIAYSVTMQSYHQEMSGVPMNFGWASVVAIDFICFLGLLASMLKIYFDANIEIGDTQLSRPSIFGRKAINWGDVTAVRWAGFGLQILAGSEKIIVSPYVYAKPDEIVETLRNKINPLQPTKKLDF